MPTISQPQATSQDIARRAAELATMNGGNTCVNWLEIAQAEADEGRTHNWVWLCAGNMLAHLKNELWIAEVYGDYETRIALRAQIKALEAEMAADAAKVEAVEVHHVPAVSPRMAAPVATKSAYTSLELMVLRRYAKAWNADGSKTVEVVVTGTLEQAEQAACVAFLTQHGEHAHNASATHKPKRRAA
jgi:hypothetical protein